MGEGEENERSRNDWLVVTDRRMDAPQEEKKLRMLTAFVRPRQRVVIFSLSIQGYMEENILPNGWLGIWRSGGVFGSAPAGESTASVLVEIENVFIVADEEKLEALATVSLPDKKNDVEGAVDNGRGCQAVVVNHPGRRDRNCRFATVIRVKPWGEIRGSEK